MVRVSSQVISCYQGHEAPSTAWYPSPALDVCTPCTNGSKYYTCNGFRDLPPSYLRFLDPLGNLCLCDELATRSYPNQEFLAQIMVIPCIETLSPHDIDAVRL